MPLEIDKRYTCAKCKGEFVGRGFAGHLSRAHPEVDKEVYYRKHIMTKGEGCCLNAECRTRPKFRSLTLGYRKVCSTTCQMKARFQDPDFAKYWSEKKSKDMERLWKDDDGTRRAISSKNFSDGMRRKHQEKGFTKRLGGLCSAALKERWNDSDWIDAVNLRRASGRSTPEYRKKRSELTTAMILDPANPFGNYRGTIIEYAGHRLRSKWELKFAKFLDSTGAAWSYEPKTFLIDGGRRYTPDFYIKELKLYVEVKPEFRRAECQFKIDAIKKQGKKIVFCTELNQRALRKRIRERLRECT